MLSLLLAGSALIAGSNVANGAGPTGLHTWGTMANDGASAVAFDQMGNLYVTGGTYGFGAGLSQVLLLKYSSNGSLVWQKVWGGNHSEVGLSVALDSLENVYVTGDGAFLLKFNSTGALVWQKAWGNVSNGFTDGNAVAVDSSGRVYVSVFLNFVNGTGNLVVLSLNPDGSLLWQKAWKAYPSQNGLGMTVDYADNIYVTGYSIGYAVLLKLNSTGNLQWQRGWLASGANGTTATSIVTDSAGNVLVGGFSFSCTNLECSTEIVNATVSKFGGNGSIIWGRAWKDTTQGFYPDSRTTRVAADGLGDIYATGNANGAFLMKLDSSGNLLQLTELGGGANVGSGIAVDSSGTPVTVGGIYAPASKYHAQVLNPALDTHVPQVVTPAGTLQDLHYPVLNLTGALMDVAGSTSYAGGIDVFINYGVTFPIPTLSPLQIILSLGSVTIVFGRLSQRRKWSKL